MSRNDFDDGAWMFESPGEETTRVRVKEEVRGVKRQADGENETSPKKVKAGQPEDSTRTKGQGRKKVGLPRMDAR